MHVLLLYNICIRINNSEGLALKHQKLMNDKSIHLAFGNKRYLHANSHIVQT